MIAQAGHASLRDLLEVYLGRDAGRRVHEGAIDRGSVETMRAVLWYADIRGFTPIADAAPGRFSSNCLMRCSKPSPRRCARARAEC